MNTEYDVIVVGGGGSGLAAAASAVETGCSVLVLEKQPHLGGTTGIAVGSFTANGTTQQKAAGIVDDPLQHEEDAGKFAAPEVEQRNNSALRTYFLSHAAETLNWLMDKGLTFYGPNPEPPNRVPRMHNVVPAAKAYIAVLEAELLQRGATIVRSAHVTRLLNSAGRVAGVEFCQSGERIASVRARRGVVLAAGDYANSPEIIAEFKGNEFSQIEGINPYAGGDGHRLAQSAGAKLLNMDVTYGPEIRFVAPPGKAFQQLLPSSPLAAKVMGRALPFVPRFLLNWMIKRLLVTWQHPENALFDHGAILVNQEGRRFCNERSWPDREIALAQQPGKIAFLLLDQRLAEMYSAWPHFISTAPKIAYAYVNDYLKLRPDVTIAAPSLDSLAQRRNLNPIALRETIDEFNRYVLGEQADPLGRTNDQHPLQGSRWVLLGPAKAYFTTTEGGAAIDQQLRVLDEQGNAIPGLYAVGQNGLGGQILWGHGLHIAWALTSGRLVGLELGKQAASPVQFGG